MIISSNSWEVEVNGKKHTINFKPSFLGITNKLIVDDEEFIVKSRNWNVNLVDYEFKIEDTVFNIVFFGRKSKLAINGVFLHNNKSYEPLNIVPNWFNVVCIVTCVIAYFLFGLLLAIYVCMAFALVLVYM